MLKAAKPPVLVVLAFTVVVAAGACTSTPRTTDERAVDSELAARVQAALRADHGIYSPHIDVDVERGEVHLKGFVYSDTERQLAQSDAESVPGVQAVVMELDLMGGGISQSSD
jgi:osmotically-inducible protein OsmY